MARFAGYASARSASRATGSRRPADIRLIRTNPQYPRTKKGPRGPFVVSVSRESVTRTGSRPCSGATPSCASRCGRAAGLWRGAALRQLLGRRTLLGSGSVAARHLEVAIDFLERHAEAQAFALQQLGDFGDGFLAHVL